MATNETQKDGVKMVGSMGEEDPDINEKYRQFLFEMEREEEMLRQ
jgi:hypothetical protein